jgi:hypothetical protein
MSSKENRYRLLLEFYPADFRREYADEMIGVLMADPHPVRKHAASLVAGAVAARLRQTLDGPEWRRAAFAVQLFGAILLFAVAARRFAMNGAMALFEPAYNTPPVNPYDVVRLVAWAVVLAATLIGLRGLSVAAGLAGLIGEIAAPSHYYADAPVMFLNVFWIMMSAAVVLIAAILAVRGPRPRGWLFVVAGGAALIANGFSRRLPFNGPVGTLSIYPFDRPGFVIDLLLIASAAGLALVGVARTEPAVRRRVIAGMVPVLVVFPLVRYGFGGMLEFNMRHPDDIQLLGTVQWAALILVPAAAFWVAAGLNQRLERTRAAQLASGQLASDRLPSGGTAASDGGTAVSAGGAPDM